MKQAIGWKERLIFYSDGFNDYEVDALNVQVKLLGADRLSRDFGGKICILADIDRQYLLPFGTPEELKEHVREIIHEFSKFDGGLISWGEIGPDVPLSNARTMLETFNK